MLFARMIIGPKVAFMASIDIVNFFANIELQCRRCSSSPFFFLGGLFYDVLVELYVKFIASVFRQLNAWRFGCTYTAIHSIISIFADVYTTYVEHLVGYREDLFHHSYTPFAACPCVRALNQNYPFSLSNRTKS